jgi:hypothetical protein
VEEKLRELHHKRVRYERIKGELVEQGMHYELILRRMEAGELKDRMEVLTGREREEIEGDEESTFHRILKAKGVIKDKENVNTVNVERQVVSNEVGIERSEVLIKEMMEEIKRLSGQVEEMRGQMMQMGMSKMIEKGLLESEKNSRAMMRDSKNTTFSFQNNYNLATVPKREVEFEVTIKESEYNDNDFERGSSSQ